MIRNPCVVCGHSVVAHSTHPLLDHEHQPAVEVASAAALHAAIDALWDAELKRLHDWLDEALWGPR